MKANYPDVFRFRVPAGFSQEVAEAAAREGLQASAYVRKIALREVKRAHVGAGSRPSHNGPQGRIAA